MLAEVYAQALRHSGVPVEVIQGLGTREIVEPALEQGQVDLVIDYLGTVLDFLSPGDTRTHGDSAVVFAALRTTLAGRPITALPYAQAQDQNGFAVTAAFAEAHSLSALSDIRELAPTMRFGGPPECSTRRHCLAGLEAKYGLHFSAFVPISTRAATAAALQAGEIQIGLLETTDPRLASGDLVLLRDDRGLQPQENIVPIVRREVLDREGGGLAATVALVSSRLTRAALFDLNRAVEIDRATPAAAAGRWLAATELSSFRLR
ncbi:MAG: osmoprotectant transport system substrate-binding protein [Frankiaceae bacterium]|nr:osmoprotectant transport system substrate-binding protein [Frankiaceae bacterium]